MRTLRKLVVVINVCFIFISQVAFGQLKDSSWCSSAGGDHFIRLKSGKVYFSDTYGDAGDNRNLNLTIVPVSNLNDIIVISAGMHHSLALDKKGRVWAWGDNNSGQLGIGSVLYKSVPVMVEQLTDIVAVSAGMYHSLALKKDGSVWAWGSNRNGQLGIDTEIFIHSRPVMIPTLKNVKSIVCGYNHSLALREDGTVWAWGYNGNGQTGDNPERVSNRPMKVPGVSDVKKIAASVFSMALKNDGTVWTWGYNLYGQLGNGNAYSTSAPGQVVELSNVKDIFCGFSHSLAITNDNVVFGWGSNQRGQLKDSREEVYLKPVELFSNTNGYKICAGAFYSMAYSEFLNDIKLWGDVFYTIHGNVTQRNEYLKRVPGNKSVLKLAGQ